MQADADQPGVEPLRPAPGVPRDHFLHYGDRAIDAVRGVARPLVRSAEGRQQTIAEKLVEGAVVRKHRLLREAEKFAQQRHEFGGRRTRGETREIHDVGEQDGHRLGADAGKIAGRLHEFIDHVGREVAGEAGAPALGVLQLPLRIYPVGDVAQRSDGAAGLVIFVHDQTAQHEMAQFAIAVDLQLDAHPVAPAREQFCEPFLEGHAVALRQERQEAVKLGAELAVLKVQQFVEPG